MLRRPPPYLRLYKVKYDTTAEILRVYYKYGHTYFNCLKSISPNDFITKRLDDFPFPVCAACLYGESIKRPCKTQTAISNKKENTPDISPSEAGLHIPSMDPSEYLIHPSEGRVYPSGGGDGFIGYEIVL